MANALAELDAAGIRLYCDQQGIDSSTPMGRAMIQMASVFGEQERSMLRARVLAGLDRVRQQGKKLGRPKVSPKVENAIRTHLSAGKGILKVAALVGVGSGTVQRVKREMAASSWRRRREVGAEGGSSILPPRRCDATWILVPHNCPKGTSNRSICRNEGLVPTPIIALIGTAYSLALRNSFMRCADAALIARKSLGLVRAVSSSSVTAHCRRDRDKRLRQEALAHSITSSARARIICGMARPRAFAVLRLTTSSNPVGCSTGRSAGLAPFKILSTYEAARRQTSNMLAL